MTNLPVATTFLVVQRDATKSDNKSTGTGSNHNKSLTLLDPTAEEERDVNASVLVLVTESEAPDRILATHSVGATTAPKLLLVDEENDDEEGNGQQQKPPRHTNTNATPTVALSLPTILACAQAASKATPAVVTFWRLAMEQRVTRESQTLWSSS